MRQIERFKFWLGQKARRRRLLRQYGREHVERLDAYAKTVSSLLQNNPTAKPLLLRIMSLTASLEEAWGERQNECGPYSGEPIDVAFRTVACLLANHLTFDPGAGTLYSLEETARFLNELWSLNPMARSALSPKDICSLIRNARAIFDRDPMDKPPPSLTLAGLTLGNRSGADVFGSLSAGSFVLALSAKTFHSIPFQIHDAALAQEDQIM